MTIFFKRTSADESQPPMYYQGILPCNEIEPKGNNEDTFNSLDELGLDPYSVVMCGIPSEYIPNMIFIGLDPTISHEDDELSSDTDDRDVELSLQTRSNLRDYLESEPNLMWYQFTSRSSVERTKL